MPIEIFRDVQQGSDDWKRLRAGIPTASEFSSVLAKGEGKTRRAYLLRLAGEVVTGEPEDTYKSPDMARGNAMEDEGRTYYEFVKKCSAERISFVKNHGAGCSPDSFVGPMGGLEIKTAKPSVLIDIWERGTFPTQHNAQVQGFLWVCEREWCDLIVYWPGVAPFIKRAMRDVKYIAELAGEVARFNDELSALVERIRSYGMAA